MNSSKKPSSGSGTDGTRDEQRPGNRAGGRRVRANHSGERIVARFEDEDE